jgi:DNA-binding MarR family transcriptional regulator
MGTLAKNGLVEPVAEDRRLTRLRLTVEGSAAARRMTKAKQQIDVAIVTVLEQHDLDATTLLLRALIQDRPAGRALARRITDEDGCG